MRILLQVQIKYDGFQMLPSLSEFVAQTGRGDLARALCRALLHVEIGLRVEALENLCRKFVEIASGIFESWKQWAGCPHIYQDNNIGIRILLEASLHEAIIIGGGALGKPAGGI